MPLGTQKHNFNNRSKTQYLEIKLKCAILNIMDLQEFSEKLNKAFREHIGIELSEKKCEQFFYFMNLLIEKNKVMNLTSITDPDEIVLRHFVDSCMPLKFYDKICSKGDVGNEVVFKTRLKKTRSTNFFEDLYLVDIGTGAGFPGLPLAIVCDRAKFVLTDSLGKRINFLSEVIDQIKISNVELVKSRAEDFCLQNEYREKFNFVFSRGVAKLSVLSEYCLPSVKLGGKMISYKMDKIEEELSDAQNAIKTLGGKFHVKHTYDLILDDPSRCLIEIDKVSRTPKSYPRKAGTPAKTPL